MELIFAKWIFTAAAIIGPGNKLDLPLASQVTAGIPQVYELVAMSDPIPCPPTYPGMASPPCQPSPTLVFQQFCTVPGVYTFTVRLGLLAQAPVGGKLWLELPGGGEALVAAFTAAPGAPAYLAGSLQVASVRQESCYGFRYEANGPAEIIADPRVSFLSVGR